MRKALILYISVNLTVEQMEPIPQMIAQIVEYSAVQRLPRAVREIARVVRAAVKSRCSGASVSPCHGSILKQPSPRDNCARCSGWRGCGLRSRSAFAGRRYGLGDTACLFPTAFLRRSGAGGKAPGPYAAAFKTQIGFQPEPAVWVLPQQTIVFSRKRRQLLSAISVLFYSLTNIFAIICLCHGPAL